MNGILTRRAGKFPRGPLFVLEGSQPALEDGELRRVDFEKLHAHARPGPDRANRRENLNGFFSVNQAEFHSCALRKRMIGRDEAAPGRNINGAAGAALTLFKVQGLGRNSKRIANRIAALHPHRTCLSRWGVLCRVVTRFGFRHTAKPRSPRANSSTFGRKHNDPDTHRVFSPSRHW